MKQPDIESHPLDQLPGWGVEPVDVEMDGGKSKQCLLLKCWRCGGQLIVARAKWRKAKFTTRPCPYCFKCSKL